MPPGSALLHTKPSMSASRPPDQMVLGQLSPLLPLSETPPSHHSPALNGLALKHSLKVGLSHCTSLLAAPESAKTVLLLWASKSQTFHLNFSLPNVFWVDKSLCYHPAGSEQGCLTGSARQCFILRLKLMRD